MLTRSIIIILFFGIFASLSAQSTNFRFQVDDQFYLRFKTNAAGHHYIEQTNTQSSLFFGYGAGSNNTDVGGTNFGEFNTAFGQFSLQENTTGQRNTALGYGCLDENTTGNSNVGIGFAALSNNLDGVNNIAIGDISLRDNLSGQNNIAIGHSSMVTGTGTGNVALGSGSGLWEGNSDNNVYVGRNAGRGETSMPSDRDDNVMIGAFAGQDVVTSGNVFLGHEAGKSAAAVDGNQLFIANSDVDSTGALIYGEFDEFNIANQLLHINGDLKVAGPVTMESSVTMEDPVTMEGSVIMASTVQMEGSVTMEGPVSIDNLYTMPTTAPVSGQFLRSTNTGANATLSWANIDAPWSIEAGDDVIYEDGDVGIGLGNAIYRLDVQDAVNNGYVARFRNTNTSSASKGIIIQTGPNVNPSSSSYYALFLDGNGTNIGGVRGNGSGGIMYSTTSDRRLKQNITTYAEGLKTVMKIRPTQYQMKSNPTVDEIGFIAQELQEILPIAVGGNATDDVETAPMTVDYSRLTPVLVAAIQEQQQIINTLQEQLDSQNQKFEQQDQQYTELRAEIMKMKGVAER